MYPAKPLLHGHRRAASAAEKAFGETSLSNRPGAGCRETPPLEGQERFRETTGECSTTPGFGDTNFLPDITKLPRHQFLASFSAIPRARSRCFARAGQGNSCHQGHLSHRMVLRGAEAYGLPEG